MIQSALKTVSRCIASGTLWVPLASHSEVHEVFATDVTSKALSIVWVADQPILEAELNLFTDSAGTQLIEAVTRELISDRVAGAHQKGLGKIDVQGLTPGQTYYYQLVNTSAVGVETVPSTGPLPAVTTARSRTVADDIGQPFANDLFMHASYHLDDSTPAGGTLLVVELPEISPYPLSALVGDAGYASPWSAVNLNNLFNRAGTNLQLESGQIIRIRELRGYDVCGSLAHHALDYYRELPPRYSFVTVQTLDRLDLCHSYDLDCNGRIDEADQGRVSQHFGSAVGECGYNADLDVIVDGIIDALDVQAVVDAIGQPTE